MISQGTIDKILNEVSIVELIASRVELKKKSRDSYIGLCPFHIEKTPSFNVSEDKGLCHCFGCGAGGNMFQFIREYEQVDFPDAVKIIADQFNIEIEYVETKQQLQQNASKQMDARSSNTLLRIVNSIFFKQLENSKDKVQIEQVGMSERSRLDFSIGFAHPNRSLFDQIEGNQNLQQVAKHIGLYKNALLRPDGRYRVTMPIKETNGEICGLYVHGANPEILGSKSKNYKNYFFGTEILSRQSERKIIVPNPLEAARCLDAGITDVCAAFHSSTLFTAKLIEKGSKKHNILIMNNTPEQFDILKSNLTTYFLGRKQITDFRVLMLPPNVNISDIYKKNGMPIVEQLIKNSISYFDLFAKIITDDLRQANITDVVKVSDYVLNLFKSSLMDSNALLDSVFLTQKLCSNLNLDFTEVFNKTNDLSIQLAKDDAVKQSIQDLDKDLDLITLDINGVQQSSLNRIIALLALNAADATSDPVTLKNLECIHNALNDESNCFSRVINKILVDTSAALSTTVLYNDLSQQEKNLISEDVGFLMQYSQSGGSFSDLKKSIKYVCNKLDIEFIDSMEEDCTNALGLF
ncbi:CHC2 zinc finger domain-containing protein (plasmid) [Shewanella xiamenensis]|uniref:CHC2 zinc finger domain-containing protein n=1 Tax=Shewanella xiamenensis TaxID=332186 RepID=A0ABT6UDP2_9GAMM|nr:CHC2 zinc finger domain-containing protein [Shewanella xiamenensis]MDI5832594.1 CHC2 zinc finger domain-containing protein [Shewanella xiamenensis]WHF57788.1 CHC2 zinc finger domain-containing protein [Shewanella xiamenensis]